MTEKERPGLYVHIPFCRSKCPYCGFYSTTDSARLPEFLEAVKKEMAFYRGRFPSFDTFSLGGGTPALLSEAELGGLIEGLFKNFSFTPGTEMTIEANPDGLTSEKLRGLAALGFNRLSLGVQSFQEKELRLLGRSHGAGDAEQALREIRAAGFRNVSLDLIYGLPGQTRGTWQADLERALAFNPEHLSCYQLTIEKGTRFWGLKEKGQMVLPSEVQEKNFFLRTSEFLETAGYVHYEISSFARGETHVSRHNQKYWQRLPYLGLGPSAHSFQGNRRWWNFRSLTSYCRALATGKVPIEDLEDLSPEQIRLETLCLGLRTRSGVDLTRLDEEGKLKTKLPELERYGWAEVSDQRIRPTRKGFLVADRLPLWLTSS
jgi:oxygen-independent coproporphyrinogen-3 oxidase